VEVEALLIQQDFTEIQRLVVLVVEDGTEILVQK
jgi:hypothetical protein